MRTVIGIKFRGNNKNYYYDPIGLHIEKDSCVVIESERGLELVTVAMGNTEVEDSSIVEPLKPILRIATEHDLQLDRKHKEQVAENYDTVVKLVEKSGLPMRLKHIEYTLDGLKLLIYFSTDGRVDFRDLAKELAGTFHIRIELRQISDRDEFTIVSGTFGTCGRECCCAKGLKIQKTNMKMAKNQGLSLNMSKLAGMCGKIMCCVAYENDHYEKINKVCPKVGSMCDLKDGRCCKVLEINYMQEKLKLKCEQQDGTEYFDIDIKDIDDLIVADNSNQNLQQSSEKVAKATKADNYRQKNFKKSQNTLANKQ